MRSLLIADKYSLVPGAGVVVFDPATLTVASMAATVAGGAVSAAGTLAGGSYAKEAGQLTQHVKNREASVSLASASRQAIDTQERARLAGSTATARAAASGFAADTGSALEDVGQIAARGEYHALMNMWNGESRAQSLRTEGDLAEYEGEQKQKASYLAAGGQLLGSAGSALSTYGKFNYPTSRGPAGASL